MKETGNENQDQSKDEKKSSNKKTMCLVLCGVLGTVVLLVSLAVVVYYMTDTKCHIKHEHGTVSSGKITSDQVTESTSDVGITNATEGDEPWAANDGSVGSDSTPDIEEKSKDNSSLEEICKKRCIKCSPSKESTTTSQIVSSQCHNRCGHGLCSIKTTAFGTERSSCTCFNGYTGSSCEDEINECQSNPCGVNGKKCVDQVNGFYCICKNGYFGKQCAMERCEGDFINFRDSCYFITGAIDLCKLPDAAQTFCRNMGAELASLNDLEEQTFVMEVINAHPDNECEYYYIGLTPPIGYTCSTIDSPCTRVGWTWDDGTTYNPVAFNAWSDGHPNEHNCIALYRPENVWKSTTCTSEGFCDGYICEKGVNRG